MNNDYPKILIIGESFHTFSGGGITMSNLFKKWPSSNLAVADFSNNIRKMDSNKVNRIYQFGTKEFQMKFPFNLLEINHKSKPIFIPKKEQDISFNKVQNIKDSRFKSNLIKLFLQFTHFLGIFHIINNTKLSDEFVYWVKDFNPDFIYTQLSQRNLIILITSLERKLNVPIVIHIMDDWPNTINKKGLFKNYWDNKINNEFKYLIDKSFVNIAISEKMASEYEIRYGRKWKYFHNPIDFSKWEENIKDDYTINKNRSILYVGRIGVANAKSIITFSKVINSLNQTNGSSFTFDIYTPDYKLYSDISNENVNIMRPIDHEDIPQLFKKYDLLYLPLDFDKKSILFSRYSIPTKLTEYLVSGVPVLVNAPKETALVNYCLGNNLGFICASNDRIVINKKVIEIFSDKKKYSLKGREAVEYVKQHHNISNVQKEFRQIFNK